MHFLRQSKINSYFSVYFPLFRFCFRVTTQCERNKCLFYLKRYWSNFEARFMANFQEFFCFRSKKILRKCISTTFAAFLMPLNWRLYWKLKYVMRKDPKNCFNQFLGNKYILTNNILTFCVCFLPKIIQWNYQWNSFDLYYDPTFKHYYLLKKYELDIISAISLLPIMCALSAFADALYFICFKMTKAHINVFGLLRVIVHS